MLETLGKDLCRTLLLHQSIHVPVEMRQEVGDDVKADLEAELNNNSDLLDVGEADSSQSGSDGAPSEDNLDPVSLQKMMPSDNSPHHSRLLKSSYQSSPLHKGSKRKPIVKSLTIKS